ncbi:MAG TPA: DEAD/DEAH box helicase [Gemmatimonadaceae bacterium]|nr:DEAD/DEAH box helicase [Gemmatimonadaceae bacterium]
MPALADVLDAIARAVGAPEADPVRLGEVTLSRQQAAAVPLLRRSLDAFGGAMLADPPGTGKTFVALAVAAAYDRCLVAAPAALRGMWRVAAEQAGVIATFVSLEALSRGGAPAPAPLVIVDEAHRVANPRARRYARVAALAHGGHLLLLTATPVRNRGAERDALLALFLGRHAAAADEALVARCVIRRDADVTPNTPQVTHHPPIRWRADRRIAALLRALPPPVALADGDDARGLVATGLARAWASSLAALDQSLVRRLQRGAAIAASLDAGRLPARTDLRAWVLGDDAMQLALPFVEGADSPVAIAASRAALDAHLTAAAALRACVAAAMPADMAWRARRLRAVCRAHPGAIVIAFTCFESTARGVFSVLRRDPGVVVLSGERAASGAGPLSRDDVLAALGPPCNTGGSVAGTTSAAATERMRLRLIIATDLLSEGVNLQRASVIVHLDDPWTPAALEQRAGRAARLGSPHDTVHVYRFAPPRAVTALLGLDRRYAAKRAAASRALRPGDVADRLRRLMMPFRRDRPADLPGAPRTIAAVAACGAHSAGCVAVVRDDARAWPVAATPRGTGDWVVTDEPARVLRLLSGARWDERDPPAGGELSRITRVIGRWIALRTARAHAGADRTVSVAARRLIVRLDRVLAAARDSARPAVAARVGRIRQLIAGARGAGAELRMMALLGRSPLDPDWLDRVERGLDVAAPAGTVRGPIELVAVLALRAGRLTAPPGPARRPSRRAVSTGTAAPR